MLKITISMLLITSLSSGYIYANDNKVVLTISGNISKYTDVSKKIYEFHESDIAKLKVYQIDTVTTWTAKSLFAGPLLRDVLVTVGAKGNSITTLALDKYKYTIPMSDLSNYSVILANSINGNKLTVATLGPFWVMYPLPTMKDDVKGLILDAKLSWQVYKIVVN